MSVVIDNITYNIEEEDLPEIEFYEIMSMDKIIKNNPTFIAFSREEIFNELYDFFENSNKANALADMFFKSNKIDITNYIFVADASKHEFSCQEDDIEKFVKSINAINKQQYKIAQTEKNKYFFALSYDNQSDKLRLKPYQKTTIELKYANMNIFYPVYADDDTNIPISAAYYRKPTVGMNDFLSERVTAHLEKPILLNYAESDDFKDINDLIKTVKPKLDLILKELKIDNDSLLDANSLDAFLQNFNSSLESIDINEFNQLRQHLQSFLTIQEHKINYQKYKITAITDVNHKIEFYNRIQNISQLLVFSDKMKEDYELLISKLQDEKMNINAPPLLYNNINDIVDAIINNEVTLETVIENLTANKNVLVIDHAINTLQGLTTNNINDIKDMLHYCTERFKLLNTAIRFFEYHFIDLYADLKDIKQADDFSMYAGLPDVYKNDGNYEGMIDDDMREITLDINPQTINQKELEKYWLSLKYRNAIGFTELLKIVLPIMKTISENSQLSLKYDLLCDELFKIFAGTSTKFHLMYNILHEAEIQVTDDYIHDIVKISPKEAISGNYVSDDIAKHIARCNQEFVRILHDMLYTGIAWWSLNIQEDILQNVQIYDEFIQNSDKWSLHGLPLKKDGKDGVLVYIATFLKDVMEDSIYTQPNNIVQTAMDKIHDIYAQKIEDMRKLFGSIGEKRNKGHETYKTLLETIKVKNKNKLLNDYMDALIYMPSYKYKKIHKFLLGCCLQKIGSHFIVDSDLIEGEHNRKDLIAAKKHYAKHREINKIRYPMYIPAKLEQDLQHDVDEYILPEPVSIVVDDMVLDDWLENMQDISPLLPNHIIVNFISNGTRGAVAFCKTYVECLCKTAGRKLIAQSEEELVLSSNKHKNILMIMCTIFKTFATELDTERTILDSAISAIHDILKQLEQLSVISTEYNIQDITRIKNLITCRALCLPCNPDTAVNNILYASVEVSNNFVRNVSRQVYDTIMNYLRTVKMPTLQENIEFINKIREQNKNKILNIMDTKTQDERNLMNTLKKIGVKYEEQNDDEINEVNEEIPQDDDFYDRQAEEEFMKYDEEEYNDDDLDAANYGFIYS